MMRGDLRLYLTLFAIGAGGFAAACVSLSPYPDADPIGPYHAGRGGAWRLGWGGAVNDSGPPDGETFDGETFDGETEGSVGLCAGCALVSSAVEPQSIALSPTAVFWTQGMTTGTPATPVAGAGSVVKAPRGSAGAPTILAPSLTGPITVKYDNDWLGWSAVAGTGAGQSSISLTNVAASGTITMPGASQNVAYGVAMDATNIYWSSDDGTGDALIQSAPLTGGGVTSLGATTSPFAVGGLAVTPTYIYFAADLVGGGGGVYQLPVTGGAPSQVWAASSTGQPHDVAVDSANVYWTDFGTGAAPDGAVYALPLGGGSIITMASGIQGPWEIALDSVNVYFSAPVIGKIYEVPIGSTTAVAIVSDAPGAAAIGADDSDSFVYFGTSSQILTHAK